MVHHGRQEFMVGPFPANIPLPILKDANEGGIVKILLQALLNILKIPDIDFNIVPLLVAQCIDCAAPFGKVNASDRTCLGSQCARNRPAARAHLQNLRPLPKGIPR